MKFRAGQNGSSKVLDGDGKVIQIEYGSRIAHQDFELNRIDRSPYGVSENIFLIDGFRSVDV